MRVLSARIRDVALDRNARRVTATVHLSLLVGGEMRCVAVRTSALITAPGAARLKDRLTAAAKLFVAMRQDMATVPDAALSDRAA